MRGFIDDLSSLPLFSETSRYSSAKCHGYHGNWRDGVRRVARGVSSDC